MKPHLALLPLSWIYGAVIWVRNLFFDIGILKQQKVPAPVISIGNITAGGTGKTPIIENITELFLLHGIIPAIITRGYGRKSKGCIVVSDGKRICNDVTLAGDEPMIALKYPQAIVIADENRVRGAKTAIEKFNANVILLDDGFQHRYLQRDVNIVLLNANDDIEKSKMLPAGYRREPPASLQRATQIVLTKCAAEKKYSEQLAGKKVFHSFFQFYELKHFFSDEKISYEDIQNKNVFLFCGIGEPKSFENSLKELGVHILGMKIFADHQEYTNDIVLDVLEEFKNSGANFLITTEKDAVKLKQCSIEEKIPLLALSMKAVIRQNEEWKTLMLGAVRK